MIEDPVFYALAIPALFLTGISKGGFGSGLGIVAVPMMALVIPVTQAAAVMLPILCLMDVFGVLGYRKSWDRANMRIMVPGAVLGIGLGTVTFGVLDEGWVRLLIGLIAVVFTAQRLLGLFPKDAAPGPMWPRACSGRRCPDLPASLPMPAGRRFRSICCRSGSTRRSLPARRCCSSPSSIMPN